MMELLQPILTQKMIDVLYKTIKIYILFIAKGLQTLRYKENNCNCYFLSINFLLI
jgi:hypothetical protein